jgi:hypothetical protein
LKKDITTLYDRLGARLDQMRELLAETQNLAGTVRAGSRGAHGAKSGGDMAMPRGAVVRSAERGASVIGSPAQRTAAALDISRGVAQLLTLVDHRKRQTAEGLDSSARWQGIDKGAKAANAARLTREVNQLLSRAS